MSYYTPQVKDKVVFVKDNGDTTEAVIKAVRDIGAGMVVLTVDRKETPSRYVDPAGATKFEAGSWHYATDDTSRIVSPIPERPQKRHDATA
jgi:hypothetical protein